MLANSNLSIKTPYDNQYIGDYTVTAAYQWTLTASGSISTIVTVFDPCITAFYYVPYMLDATMYSMQI